MSEHRAVCVRERVSRLSLTLQPPDLPKSQGSVHPVCLSNVIFSAAPAAFEHPRRSLQSSGVGPAGAGGSPSADPWLRRGSKEPAVVSRGNR
jgi:hypothetical protein